MVAIWFAAAIAFLTAAGALAGAAASPLDSSCAWSPGASGAGAAGAGPPCVDWSWSEIEARLSASCWPRLSSESSWRWRACRAATRSARRASSAARVRSTSRFWAAIASRALVRPVAGRAHAVHRGAGLVAQGPHSLDHRVEVVLVGVEVVALRDHVGPAGGVEDHAQGVRVASLVDLHQLRAEHPHRSLQLCTDYLQVMALAGQLRLRAVELGLLGGQLPGHRRGLGAGRRDLADQLVDLAILLGEACRDVVLGGLVVVDLGLGVLELLLQALSPRAPPATPANTHSDASTKSAKTSGTRRRVPLWMSGEPVRICPVEARIAGTTGGAG